MRWLPTKREMLPVLGTDLVVWGSWKRQYNHGLDLYKIATKILSLLVFFVSHSRVKVGSYFISFHCQSASLAPLWSTVYKSTSLLTSETKCILAIDHLRMRLIESQTIPAGLITESLRKILLTNPDNIVPEALPLCELLPSVDALGFRNSLCFSFRQKLPDKATLPNVTAGTSAQRAGEQD